MRILISGQKQFGADVLRAVLAAGHDVAAVSAPPHSGRLATTGEAMPDRLRYAAEAGGVPWIPSEGFRAALVPDGVDLIIAAHSHAFISAAARNRTRLGAIGYHPSLLPIHRGRDAVRWAVHGRDRVTGGSVYWLTNAVDGGPLAAQSHVLIAPDDTPETLWRGKLAPLGVRLILRVLADLGAGRKVAVPQDEAMATWEPSWGRPPVFRPDLPQIGNGCAPPVRVTCDLDLDPNDYHPAVGLE